MECDSNLICDLYLSKFLTKMVCYLIYLISDMSQLEYPDDDLDAMLDEEMEIMNEMEKENQQVRQEQEFLSSASVSLGGIRASEKNVGLNKESNLSGKRVRNEEENWEDPGWNSIEDEFEIIKKSEMTPEAKRFKRGNTDSVLSEIKENGASRIKVPKMLGFMSLSEQK